jgi:dolichol-phosphate mannosyltransferase
MRRQPWEDPTVQSMRLRVVIPTYKEAQNLWEVVFRPGRALADLHGGFGVVIVDDDSRDGSEQIVAELAIQGYSVRIIICVGECRLASPVNRGFQAARGELLLCMLELP